MSKLTALFTLATLAFAIEPTEILTRLRANDLIWLRTQVKDPSFLTTKDSRRNTPLLFAALQGSPEAVSILLAAGADPNAANALGLTPLIAAAPEPAKVKLLLARGADPKLKSEIGQTALVVAASTPTASESVKLLLAAGADPNQRGARGATPLLSAIGNSCAETNAQLLLAAGADAKAIDGAGFGAMHGVLSCSLPLLESLKARGANINQQNTFGGSVKKGPVQLIGISPLMLASTHRETPIVKFLLDSGADVKAKDVRGMTPLIYAVSSEEQNPAVIKLLLDRGADPKAKDINGDDAVAWARRFNSPTTLKLLGAKPTPIKLTKLPKTNGPGPQAALSLLESSNETFFKESGCNACHHSVLLSFAGNQAQSAGFKPNPDLVTARTARLRGMTGSFMNAFQQLIPPGGEIDSLLYILLEARALNLPSTPDLETVSRFVWARQHPTGAFTQRGISRSPIEESDIHRTALAIWLLPTYSDASAREANATRLDKAVKWLTAQSARNNDELAMKLLGLKWGGASSVEVARTAAALAATQRKDGSFAGNKHLPGGPYATGLSLFALREGAGWPAANATITRAAAWLRATQRPDASWYQPSRSPKFQPYFESGFPYGHDQWISASATAWAIIGLSQAGGM